MYLMEQKKNNTKFVQIFWLFRLTEKKQQQKNTRFVQRGVIEVSPNCQKKVMIPQENKSDF